MITSVDMCRINTERSRLGNICKYLGLEKAKYPEGSNLWNTPVGYIHQIDVSWDFIMYAFKEVCARVPKKRWEIDSYSTLRDKLEKKILLFDKDSALIVLSKLVTRIETDKYGKKN